MIDLKSLSLEELEQMLSQEKLKISMFEAEKQLYRETHLIEFFEPFPHQAKALEYLNAGKKTVLLQGANQIGKTVFGAVFTGAACLGIQPWDKRPTIFGDKPISVRIVCEDYEHHADKVIIPELKKWLPVGQYTIKKNNIGTEAFWQFKNGSTIEIMTNAQDTKLHESWKGDLVWADEPTSHDKYVANSRGLISRNGVFLMTMTAVRESWILDEIVRNTDPSFSCVTDVPMTDNPTLGEDAIRIYASKLLEDEKVARLYGGWLNLVGLIWKGFRTNVHVIDPFAVPLDWPVVAMIDWHTNKPHAVSYYAVDPHGMWYLVDETWVNESAEEVADRIIRKTKSDDCWRIERAFIDPLSKGDTQYSKRMGIQIDDSYTTIETRLRGAGIRLETASKDKGSGIKNVEKMLSGVNGRPSLFFFRSLVNKIPNEGTVWEMQRWNYDEDGNPKKENDHFCENLYRLTLTGVKYTDPRVSRLTARGEAYNPLTYGLEVAV